jgi:DNA-directed RNA polymerase specialized sigma24 family protein
MNLDWKYLSDLADKVARSIAASWSVVEKDDVKQEILLHAYAKRAAIEQHYGDEDMLWRIFRTAGIQYASAERDARDLLDDRYYYTPGEAKAALRTFLYTSAELGDMLGKKDDLLSCTVSDNLVTARMDAAASMKKLPARYQQLLIKKYVYGLPVDNTADAMALSRAAVALARAMNRMVRST